jgi:ABC-type branched-subunit amino acid transport system substrate-binding protein
LAALLLTASLISTGALTAAGAGAQSGTTRGVSAKEIKVGGLGDSELFFDEATMGLGAKARFARANETGEIPGKRQINLVAWGDVKADTATAVQEERRLIDQEGVFAIVPNSSVFTAAELPNQRHVPVFGFGIAQAYCSSTKAINYFFGFDGCVVPPPDTKTAADNVSLMKSAAEKEGYIESGSTGRFAVIGTDNDTGRRAVALFAAAAQANDLDVVYAKAPSPPPPAVVGDYTPYVNEVLSTNPDIIMTVGVTSDYIGLAKALQNTDFAGMYVIPAADPRLANIMGLAPSYGQTNWATNEAAPTTPPVQQMLDDIEAYEPGTLVSTPVAAGWLAADDFITALKRTGKNLTAEKLQKVAASTTYFRKGFIGPTLYPKNFLYSYPACHSIVKWDGQAYSIVEPYSCSKERYPLKPYDKIETP